MKLRSPFTNGFNDTAAADLAGVLTVLADPTRLRILALLNTNGSLRVAELVAYLPLKQPTISHHLGKMERLGLITKKRDGHYQICRVEYRALAAVASALNPWQDS